jgi:hypothetical protein
MEQSKMELWCIWSKDFNYPIWSQSIQIRFPRILWLIQNSWTFGKSFQHEKCSKLDYITSCKFLDFIPHLAILFNFLKSKNRSPFPKFLIQFPSWIWRHSYGESCSSLQILQNHIIIQNFQAWGCHFWGSQNLNDLDWFWNGLNSISNQI